MEGINVGLRELITMIHALGDAINQDENRLNSYRIYGVYGNYIKGSERAVKMIRTRIAGRRRLQAKLIKVL